MKSKLILELSKIQLVIENTKILKSTNLRKFILGCFLDQFWDSSESVYKQIIDFIKPKEKILMKESRDNYQKLSDSFALLFGLPSTFYIEFVDNWELKNNIELHNFITTDDYEVILSKEEELIRNSNKNNTDELKQQIIMNTRQRVGCETPKKKIHRIELNHINNICSSDPILKSEESMGVGKVFKRSDSTRSVEFREEIAPDKTKLIKLKSNLKKNKVPKYKSPPKDKDCSKINRLNDEELINNEMVLNTVNSREIENSHNTDTNLSIFFTKLDLKSEGNHEKDITENTFNKNTQLLIYSLRRIIFARIKKGLFLKYKEDTMVKELEEIKIYHFKPNCKVEVLTLKEKLDNKDSDRKDIRSNLVIFDQKPNLSGPSEIKVSPKNVNHKKIEINKKSFIDLNEGILDINNNKTDHKIKPFDLLNIKKSSGNVKNINRLREINNTNQNNNNLQEAIKRKFDEINEKLKNYETLAQNLGKEFNKQYNK